MTTMDHAVLRELAAGGALDDLDPAERAALDAHLPTCGGCRRLTVDLHDVLGELALVSPALEPPKALRAAVLGGLRATGRSRLTLVTEGGIALDAAAPMAGRPASPRRSADRFARWGGLAAAAVFAIVAVGLGVETRRLGDEVASANLALADARLQLDVRQAAVTVAADPAHVTVALHAESIAPVAHAVVMFRPGSDDAVLMATDLPATPAGHVYQLWYADAAGAHPLGTYAFDGHGAFVAPFGVDLAGSAAAMVTLEPTGGATGEPGPQVVFGEL